MGGCANSKLSHNQIDAEKAVKEDFPKTVDEDEELEEDDNDDDVMSDSAFNHKASTKMSTY